MSTSATLESNFAQESTQPQLSRHELGLRIINSMFLCIVLQVVSAGLGIVFLHHVIYCLVSQRKPDENVVAFGVTHSRYLCEIFRYLTFNRGSAPDLFIDWRNSA